MHLGAFCIANAPDREREPRDARSTASTSYTGAESDPVDPRACISRDPARLYRPRAPPLSCNSSLQPIATSVVHKLQPWW